MSVIFWNKKLAVSTALISCLLKQKGRRVDSLDFFLINVSHPLKQKSHRVDSLITATGSIGAANASLKIENRHDNFFVSDCLGIRTPSGEVCDNKVDIMTTCALILQCVLFCGISWGKSLLLSKRQPFEATYLSFDQDCDLIHRKGYVILKKLSSLTTPEVFKMAASSATTMLNWLLL